MTKQLNKTIRSLRRALKEIKSVKMEDYVVENVSAQSMDRWFSEYLKEAQFHLEVILNDTEEKYHKIHKNGAYHD